MSLGPRCKIEEYMPGYDEVSEIENEITEEEIDDQD